VQVPAHAAVVIINSNVQVPAHAAVVIINSNVKHQLAGLDSEYNSRRSQCEKAAKYFGVVALRDITAEQHEARSLLLLFFFFFLLLLLLLLFLLFLIILKPGDEWHVVTENERTIEALSALEKGDLKNERTIEALGALEKGDLKAMAKLMAASHVSMRDDFEISVPEIDAL
ncbi:GHMP kinase, partial [Baffinella frigidus]